MPRPIGLASAEIAISGVHKWYGHYQAWTF
ncbi:hypothetical protein J2Z31_000140 [Sinorhizobium kostiense]|uniref:ABC transporter ATP-binding protein n=1 Tax=Sinorhizobium kostiense TaxID=76747 RepID=A0ABS4QSL5_9HYPH|nr:hypothetical protein [Sinorhizobium kostiense]